jgi:hypothetical protein
VNWFRVLEHADSLFSPGHLAEGIEFRHPGARRATITAAPADAQ